MMSYSDPWVLVEVTDMGRPTGRGLDPAGVVVEIGLDTPLMLFEEQWGARRYEGPCEGLSADSHLATRKACNVEVREGGARPPVDPVQYQAGMDAMYARVLEKMEAARG